MTRSNLPVTLTVLVGSTVLWLLSLGELARQPVTHSGTMPLRRQPVGMAPQSYQQVGR